MWQQIKQVYSKYKVPILIGLGVVVLLQWCQNQANKQFRSAAPMEHNAGELPPPVSVPDAVPAANAWLPYLIMVGLVLVVFVLQRRGWLEKLFPSIVLVRCKPSNKNGQQTLRIFFMNAKRRNVVFGPPIVEFVGLGKSLSFKISAKSGDVMFPLTMTPSVGHSMVVDLAKIFAINPTAKKYRWVRVRMSVDGVKTAKSFPHFIWVR